MVSAKTQVTRRISRGEINLAEVQDAVLEAFKTHPSLVRSIPKSLILKTTNWHFFDSADLPGAEQLGNVTGI